MGAKQWALILLLFLLSGPCSFYSHRTAHTLYYHCNNNCLLTMFLLALASQTNQGHREETMGFLPWLYYIFLRSYTYSEHTVVFIPSLQQLFLKSRRSYNDQGQIPITMSFLLQLFHISVGCYTDPEQIPMSALSS